MKTCGNPSTTQFLGTAAASPGYLHPAQLLERGLSCLPYPTLFLLRSQIALSLSPFSIIIILSVEKPVGCWPEAGLPTETLSFTEHPASTQVSRYLDGSPQVP